MMIAVFLYPLMYWYITIPEILYIIYAGLRSVARGTGMGEIYFIGLAIYYSTFIWNQTGTMIVTAALILIDIICHAHAGRTEQAGYSDPAYIHHDTNEEDYGYDSCPYCGSGDTDGNHCYECDEDF